MLLERVSATQVDAFENCQRYWFNGWVLKLEMPKSPALELGNQFHDAAEKYLKGEDIDQPLAIRKLLDAALPYLPLPPQEQVEIWYEMPTYEGGPRWVGKIDLVEDEGDGIRITDHKTTSDFRYAKLPGELLTNTQMVAYAKWGFDNYDVDELVVRHLNVRTKGKAKAHPVEATAQRAPISALWDEKLGVVRSMVAVAASCTESDEVEPTTTACDRFGGCPFRKRCGLDQGGLDMSKLSEKLKKAGGPAPSAPSAPSAPKSNGLAAKVQKALADRPPPPVTPTPTVSVNVGVVPPDGAPRDEKPPKEEKPQKAKPEKKEKANGNGGFSIYMDCLPVKGPDREYTLFEDWIAPLAEQVAEAHGISDYRLISYGGGKVALATLVRENLHTVPKAIVVSSFSPGSNEAIDVLIPHATKVVRALRG